ncbi:MAG TPA: IS1595 family transposase, partial [Nitrospiraceae bacterium]|nr:IS1595 family transposase [Nitrospiraceae bacterium]
MDANVFKSGFFHNETEAYEFLEKLRWPNGPVCVHCKKTEKIYRYKPTRTGRRVLKCGHCRKQFTVTLGTIFEDSHLPLTKWMGAYHLLCASKKGMSAHQLHRMLGITYKSAWFMAHRIRHTMKQNPFTEKLDGVVEADETYIGGMGHGQQG